MWWVFEWRLQLLSLSSAPPKRQSIKALKRQQQLLVLLFFCFCFQTRASMCVFSGLLLLWLTSAFLWMRLPAWCGHRWLINSNRFFDALDMSMVIRRCYCCHFALLWKWQSKSDALATTSVSCVWLLELRFCNLALNVLVCGTLNVESVRGISYNYYSN